MPPKRKRRVYENNALTRDAVNLSEQRNYNKWREGPRAAPYWKTFEDGFLKSKQFTEGQKGDEFMNVYNQILEGERNGAGKYSSDGAETKLQNGLDWQAWLLQKLVHNNVAYRDGCLFGSTDSKPVVFEKMWNTIKNELRNRSRRAKNASKAIKKTTPKKRGREEDSSGSEQELDPKAGTALVSWVNLPLPLRKTVQSEEVFHSFCGYDLVEFRKAVEDRFDLSSHQHVVVELAESCNCDFSDTQSMAAKADNEGVFFTLKTRRAVLEEETLPPPAMTVATPKGHQAVNEAEHRRLAWAEMVADARSKGSNQVDLAVPLWQFTFLKSLAQDGTEVKVEDVVLRLDDVNDEESTLEVSCSHVQTPCLDMADHTVHSWFARLDQSSERQPRRQR